MCPLFRLRRIRGPLFKSFKSLKALIRELVKSSTRQIVEIAIQIAAESRSHRIISYLCHLLAACCQLPAVSCLIVTPVRHLVKS